MAGQKTPVIVQLWNSQSLYIVPPRTACYSLVFNEITDTALRFRFNDGSEWMRAREGDSYSFDPAIQSGILFDLSSASGPSPSVIVAYSTTPCGLNKE